MSWEVHGNGLDLGGGYYGKNGKIHFVPPRQPSVIICREALLAEPPSKDDYNMIASSCECCSKHPTHWYYDRETSELVKSFCEEWHELYKKWQKNDTREETTPPPNYDDTFMLEHQGITYLINPYYPIDSHDTILYDVSSFKRVGVLSKETNELILI